MELQIGKTLSRLLKEKRVSLKELSAATGVPSSTLSQWSANRSPKNTVQVAAVAKFLDVTMHYLLFGEEDGNQAFDLAQVLKQDLFSGVFEISIKKVQIKNQR